jgi:hypothetical protein
MDLPACSYLQGNGHRFDISDRCGETEVRFTHVGLAPEHECYGVCSNAWGMLINGSLRGLITTGEPRPVPFAA